MCSNVWPSAMFIVIEKADLMGNCRRLQIKFFDLTDETILMLGKNNEATSTFSISATFG